MSLSLDWHPNNVLVACGSTDFKARVFSAYIKEVDEKPSATCWGKKMTFANMMAEYANSCWVHSVSFNKTGDMLAWVSHDSSVSIVNPASSTPHATVTTQFLPFQACIWVTPNSIIAAGHDCTPMQFVYNGQDKVTFAGKVDQEKKSGPKKITAKEHFKSLDSYAQSQESSDATLGTLHQSSITNLQIHTGDKASCTKFSSVGIDGQMIIWDFKSLESAMGNLRM